MVITLFIIYHLVVNFTIILYPVMSTQLSAFFFFNKVLLLGIFSVHTPGYKNDLNCSFNQFTCVVTHPVRGIKGSDLLGLIVLQ